MTEAKILSLLDGSLEPIKGNSNVTVPSLLHHDPQHHVMVMSDLGQIPNLSEVFSVFGGYTPNAIPAAVVQAINRYDDNQYELHRKYHSTVGTRLGTFFALLHSQRTLSEVLRWTSATGVELHNSELLDSVHEFAIKPIESRLALFADLIPVSRSASMLYERIGSDWLRKTREDEKSFVLGDCWTGAVLVSPPIHDKSRVHNVNHTVGVIDWEFASIGRGPHGDISQFLAHLELFRHTAVWRKSEHHVHMLDTIISSFVRAYKDVSSSDQSQVNRRVAGDSKASPDPASLSARMIRSALLMLASEMFNCAFWKVWPCFEPSCPALVSNQPTNEDGQSGSARGDTKVPTRKRRPSFQTYSSPPLPSHNEDSCLPGTNEHSNFNELDSLHDQERLHLCPLIRGMVKSTIWLICRAGKDEAEMCQDSNWKELSCGLPAPAQCVSLHASGTLAEAVGEVIGEKEGGIVDDSNLVADREKRLWLLDLFT